MTSGECRAIAFARLLGRDSPDPGSAQRKLTQNSAPNGDLTVCPELVEGTPFEQNRMIKSKCDCSTGTVDKSSIADIIQHTLNYIRRVARPL